MVQPRLVENRVYAYKAYPQAVEDELDRKDTRLVPSRQCLSTVKRPPALLACVYSRALATLHAVRKETTMKTTAVIGSTTNPIPYKGGEMSKQTLREGPMGKENHRREGELNLSPLGTRQAPPSSDAPSCLRSYYSTAFCVCQGVFEKSLKSFPRGISLN